MRVDSITIEAWDCVPESCPGLWLLVPVAFDDMLTQAVFVNLLLANEMGSGKRGSTSSAICRTLRDKAMHSNGSVTFYTFGIGVWPWITFDAESATLPHSI